MLSRRTVWSLLISFTYIYFVLFPFEHFFSPFIVLSLYCLPIFARCATFSSMQFNFSTKIVKFGYTLSLIFSNAIVLIMCGILRFAPDSESKQKISFIQIQNEENAAYFLLLECKRIFDLSSDWQFTHRIKAVHHRQINFTTLEWKKNMYVTQWKQIEPVLLFSFLCSRSLFLSFFSFVIVWVLKCRKPVCINLHI